MSLQLPSTRRQITYPVTRNPLRTPPGTTKDYLIRVNVQIVSGEYPGSNTHAVSSTLDHTTLSPTFASPPPTLFQILIYTRVDFIPQIPQLDSLPLFPLPHFAESVSYIYYYHPPIFSRYVSSQRRTFTCRKLYTCIQHVLPSTTRLWAAQLKQ